jgi:hypothetical protein
VSEHGDWTQVRAGVIHYHPEHPEYLLSDDAYIDATYRTFEAGEEQFFLDRDHDTALVLDQFHNESPQADTTYLQVWDHNDQTVTEWLDDETYAVDESAPNRPLPPWCGAADVAPCAK